MASELSLAVVILTYNEEMHIGRAIGSIAGIARDILIVDSGSTDATAEIARAAGARVLERPFVNQAQQFQWALDHGAITADWILRLDADEVIEPDLAQAIAGRLPTLPPDVVGINLNRKQIFMGSWVRRGGRYPLMMLRLFRRGHGRVEDRWMDEHIVVDGGRTIDLAGGFADVPLRDLSFFTAKHNSYATREAIEVVAQRFGLFDQDQADADRLGAAQARRRRAIKQHVYNRLPLGVGPLLYFLFRYILQRGFLDGRAGLVYHMLQGFWYRFLVDAKVLELEQALRPVAGMEERRRRLGELTGYAIAARRAAPRNRG